MIFIIFSILIAAATAAAVILKLKILVVVGSTMIFLLLLFADLIIGLTSFVRCDKCGKWIFEIKAKKERDAITPQIFQYRCPKGCQLTR